MFEALIVKILKRSSFSLKILVLMKKELSMRVYSVRLPFPPHTLQDDFEFNSIFMIFFVNRLSELRGLALYCKCNIQLNGRRKKYSPLFYESLLTFSVMEELRFLFLWMKLLNILLFFYIYFSLRVMLIRQSFSVRGLGCQTERKHCMIIMKLLTLYQNGIFF